jgi:hypothetical protein
MRGLYSTEGNEQMKRTGDADTSRVQLAFWGYTNSPGADAAVNLARQLRRCEGALDGRAEITRFFYEMPQPVNDLMALAVRDAGGPSHYDGGWDDLAAALPIADRGFEAIICHSADRLGRVFSRGLAKELLAAEHGVPILSADQPIVDLADIDEKPTARFQRHLLQWIRDCDYDSTTSILRPQRDACG